MPYYVFIAVVGSAVLHAGWNAALRASGDRKNTTAWIGLASLLVSAPWAASHGFPTGAASYVLTSALLHVIYLYLLAAAYRHSELSFAYPIARGSSPMLVALGGFLFAGEKLAPFQFAGIVLVVAGILVIGLESRQWDARAFWLAMLIGATIAIYTVCDALGARRSTNSAQYNAWEFSFYGLAVTLIYLFSKKNSGFSGSAKSIGLGFIGGVASVAAYAIVVWAMTRTSMGPVSAIRECSALFATLIGWLILKERFSYFKLAGSAAVFSGALCIGLSR